VSNAKLAEGGIRVQALRRRGEQVGPPVCGALVPPPQALGEVVEVAGRSSFDVEIDCDIPPLNRDGHSKPGSIRSANTEALSYKRDT
jgi:hypothetical protein